MIKLAVMCLLLAGCFGARVAVAAAPTVQATPGAVLDVWGAWSTYVGSGLLLAATMSLVSFAFLFFPPTKLAGLLAVAGIALVISGQLFVWLEDSLWFLSAGTLLLGAGAGALLLWKHRNTVENALDIDIDRNGRVGA